MAAATPEVGTKRCNACRQDKSKDNFWRSSDAKDGLQSRCNSCSNEHRRESYKRWTPEQRESHRRRVIRYRYGVELDLVDALYERQEGCCAICGDPGDKPFGKDKRESVVGILCIDHDHKTGEIRGLLCTNCNVGLGRFHEDIPTFVRAMDYIVRGGVI